MRLPIALTALLPFITTITASPQIEPSHVNLTKKLPLVITVTSRTTLTSTLTTTSYTRTFTALCLCAPCPPFERDCPATTTTSSTVTTATTTKYHPTHIAICGCVPCPQNTVTVVTGWNESPCPTWSCPTPVTQTVWPTCGPCGPTTTTVYAKPTAR